MFASSCKIWATRSDFINLYCSRSLVIFLLSSLHFLTWGLLQNPVDLHQNICGPGFISFPRIVNSAGITIPRNNIFTFLSLILSLPTVIFTQNVAAYPQILTRYNPDCGSAKVVLSSPRLALNPGRYNTSFLYVILDKWKCLAQAVSSRLLTTEARVLF
jgi:hypothetical protein